MRRARATALLALMVLAAGALAQSVVPLGARLRVRWQGRTVRLIEGGRTHLVSIEGQFNGAGLESVKLQSAKEANGAIYLLLDVSGPSKIPPDARQCGAGVESNLIWLKLDQNWKLLDAKNFLYDSCWSPIGSSDGPAWQGDTLTVTADKFSADSTETMVATYSYNRPEEGLKVTTRPAAK
ncbi:MAG TPA: hypothetical protein VJ723_15815 [Candidatus Angelobacter sp.]|nr:hypothetical protein [Candidatus Angelobacter sp.]